MNALMITPTLIDAFWPAVVEKLQPTIDLFDGYNLEDVYHSLITGDSILWVVVDDHKVMHCAGVCKYIQYPQKKTCLIRMAGGKNPDAWVHLLKDVEDWAIALECKDLEFIGRPGWAKLLPDYEMTARVFKKSLGD